MLSVTPSPQKGKKIHSLPVTKDEDEGCLFGRSDKHGKLHVGVPWQVAVVIVSLRRSAWTSSLQKVSRSATRRASASSTTH